MVTKQLFRRQDADDIVYDVHDLIFRRNCINYFNAKKKVDASNAADIREFHPTPSKKTSELVHVIAGENPKIQFYSIRCTRSYVFIPDKNAKLKEFLCFKVATPKISHDDKVEELKADVPSPELPMVQELEGFQTEMILAVDATPTRVGGLLRLPENERTIFYYSISWTTHFEFDDSTKFEMVNAALALELFKPYLKAYRERYDKLIVKTDSHFYESIKGFKDPLDVKFLMGVRNNVKCLRGEFQHVVVSQKDADIQNADYLSRTELPIGLKIEYVESSSRKEKATSYALVDLSAVARGHTLDVIKEHVPKKYINGYRYY